MTQLEETLELLNREWATVSQSGATDDRLMLIALELRGIRELLLERLPPARKENDS